MPNWLQKILGLKPHECVFKRECVVARYEYPSQSSGWPAYAVADRVRYAAKRCRCGEVEIGKETARVELQGLSMPTSRWDLLKSKGWIPA